MQVEHGEKLTCFICRAAFREAMGCAHGDPKCYDFMITPDGSAALIFDFERSEERSEDRTRWEVENFEANMREDEDAEQDMSKVKWRERCLQERLKVAVSMSEEDELRMHEVGEGEWVAEKVRERLRGELPDQPN
jgi:hypothetical protein